MRRNTLLAVLVGIGIAGSAGCGGGGGTTVINKTSPAPAAQTTTVTTTTAKPQAQESPPPETTTATASPGGPPKVTGLTLPEAKKELSAAGFKADVSNTDTTFGILVPQNYTVCKQSTPRGNIVPILAQKYGC
jgi:PASTA domain